MGASFSSCIVIVASFHKVSRGSERQNEQQCRCTASRMLHRGAVGRLGGALISFEQGFGMLSRSIALTAEHASQFLYAIFPA